MGCAGSPPREAPPLSANHAWPRPIASAEDQDADVLLGQEPDENKPKESLMVVLG
jgi:hypothetical protein